MTKVSQNALKILGVLFITGITVTLLIWTRPDTLAELQPPTPSHVITGEVKLMDIQTVTSVTGKLQPVRKASLRFEVAGRITERLVEPGQSVNAGDTLIRIEDGDFRDAVDEARARFTQEQAAVDRDRELLALTVKKREIQEREVERLARLGQESLASKSHYDEALRVLLQQREEEARLRHSVNTASSRLLAERAALNRAERNLERTLLTAPFQATVNAVNIEVGDYISAGQIALELIQLDELDLYLETIGEVVNQLQRGQSIQLLSNEEKYVGTIVAIAADPDPETHTHALRIRVTGSNLYPGQLAEAELPGQMLTDVEVIPLSAILREEGRAYLFEVKDNHLVRTPVKLKARQDDWQVISGVSAGTRIVTRDVTALADGQEVFVD